MRTLIKVARRPITGTLAAILLGFIVAAILLGAAGFDPGASFTALFQGILSRPRYISNTIIKASPIILTGVSVAFAFKTGLFNIGAEGQYIAGAVCAVLVGAKLDLPAPIQIPIVVLAGVAGGAIIGAITGELKARFGIHEVITAIMLNWIMLYINNFIVMSDLYHRPNSTGSLAVSPSSFTTILGEWKISRAGQDMLRGMDWLQDFLVRPDVNIMFVAAILVAALAWFMLHRSKFGFALRAVGFNRDAAEFAGISVQRSMLCAMTFAGAISGLAGALVITGMQPHSLATLAAFENNGFNGFSVALIAGSSPLACIPAGLLFGGLIYGGQNMQLAVGAPTEIINIMIGTIVFFVALKHVFSILTSRLERRAEREAHRLGSEDGAAPPPPAERMTEEASAAERESECSRAPGEDRRDARQGGGTDAQ
ncbi:nucleoside ABC transporter membrane protein [Coriobacterium glomerans PW2]|uniref:Nucleoside ABC transporter membrane protein n=1 Tax=Coriobacterium glomerans (strain ATCC 49209 / DSM 20642 / JCM 10262 / PW2) TaxID=700015 RepID=F2NB99_CORGP|nr:ABC transporter permease [Coriobacterium glomerans]AEB06635.1 nucleoside ABC transporter membrane protein [Coriobacterium glomerans PW2]